ncbi:GIY-YIG nuclease family protein [Arthrobacter dokdonensis]|uniref:GIY-YIG nuclease family protein n=1 Tax=Arthrobacter dokdonellae TaxID=2211210 RepID=UPI000DE5B45E|nr:GIY-YIG nuclease family protein [Arthrobacter dokdonellae]
MHAISRPQTIQIFLPQGDPSGIRMAEITTRTVRVFDVPRSLVSGFLAMPEASQVGLYFLFGIGSEDGTACYIGQSGNVGGRLKQHVSGKDFWERAIVAVSLTNTWTDTHVGFMEWEAISRAGKASRYPLLNGNAASNRYTPAPLEADCNEYLETISVLIATLGYPALESIRKNTRESPSEVAAERLYLRQSGCQAEADPTSEGLVVLAGSVGNSRSRPSAAKSIVRGRQSLVERGIAEIRGDQIVMAHDYLFSSPSQAAAMLVGGSVNGRDSWKNAAGKSVNEIEADIVEKTVTAQVVQSLGRTPAF